MSRRENKQESGGWGTLATVGGMVAAFGIGAFLSSKFHETPQAHSSSSRSHSPPPPRPPPSQPRQMHNAQPEECTVCFESINTKRLPCGHYFHSDCIKAWEDKNESLDLPYNCPTCRSEY